MEAGRQVRLRTHIPQLVDFLAKGTELGVILVLRRLRGAARIVLSALDGIVPPDHSWHGAGLRAALGRGAFDPPRARGLREGGRCRAAWRRARDRPGPDDLRWGRHLKRARDAARERSRRLHDRRFGEQAHRADRVRTVLSHTLSACRCRYSSRSSAGGLRTSGPVRVLRPHPARMGEGADRLGTVRELPAAPAPPSHNRATRSRNDHAPRGVLPGFGRRRRSSSRP